MVGMRARKSKRLHNLGLDDYSLRPIRFMNLRDGMMLRIGCLDNRRLCCKGTGGYLIINLGLRLTDVEHGILPIPRITMQYLVSL